MLNFDKIGKTLAKIQNGKYHNKTISVFCGEGKDEDEITKQFTSLKLNGDAVFQQVPNPDTEREIIYITGASGSGKSTYISKYLKEYKKLHKNNPIYVFSALKEDESLDNIPSLKRIKIDSTLVSDPIPIDDFANSCVIFDDCDVISDKKIREAVYNVLNQVLEVGRHHKISCCISNHLPTGGKDTRRVLNECHSVVYFPHSGSLKSLKYLLKEYVGLDDKDMKRIKNSKSRWACIFKNYPQIAMTNKDLYLLSNCDDD